MNRRNETDATAPCPCGSGVSLGDCCGPVIDGDRQALTAERLMRSRFTAFALGDSFHLLRSWHSSSRPAEVRFVPGQRWTRLEILDVIGGGPLDTEGEVEFRAHHVRDGRTGTLQERSRFVRDDRQRWTYVASVAAR